MILLDTNIVSEIMRPMPYPTVLSWFNQQQIGQVYVSAVTEAEIRYGAALLPAGRRRTALQKEIEGVFAEDFSDHVLPFDHDAAPHFAAVTAHRRSLGRPIAMADAMIAAIALANGCRLATRNVKDFADTGADVIDPFAEK